METPHPHILEKSTDTKHYYYHNHHHHHHHQQQQEEKHNQVPSSTTTTISPASPPSSSSSPSHEFSFTISLHSSIPTTKTTTTSLSSSSISNNKLSKTNNNSSITINSSTSTTSSSSSTALANAIDLSPADEIFFHGHLLPLHLLSHLPTISPRSSTNSLDSFTLPITDFHIDPSSIVAPLPPPPSTRPSKATFCTPTTTAATTSKSKSFSLFTKWKTTTTTKPNNDDEMIGEEGNKEKRKRSARLEVMSRALKRYLRMVRPLLLLGGRRRRESGLRRQPHSFSGVLGPRNNTSNSQKEIFSKLNRPGQYSAPASMRTSPSNSGLLVPSPASDSTMEELQAAIQAAIAHCKNSIASTHDNSPSFS